MSLLYNNEAVNTAEEDHLHIVANLDDWTGLLSQVLDWAGPGVQEAAGCSRAID